MEANREKKLVTNICSIKGYCPKRYLPQVIKALESDDTFEGFIRVEEGEKTIFELADEEIKEKKEN